MLLLYASLSSHLLQVLSIQKFKWISILNLIKNNCKIVFYHATVDIDQQ